MKNIINISDYVIFRCKVEGDTDLSALKHQKLLYYIQAWHLAFFEKKAFEGDFQAWIHGPVNRDIYELYKGKKYLYSEMTMDDLVDNDIAQKLDNNIKQHIDIILDAYAKFSATELETMTHNEKPWIEAREGFLPNERCEKIINPETMKTYYASRLSK